MNTDTNLYEHCGYIESISIEQCEYTGAMQVCREDSLPRRPSSPTMLLFSAFVGVDAAGLEACLLCTQSDTLLGVPVPGRPKIVL